MNLTPSPLINATSIKPYHQFLTNAKFLPEDEKIKAYRFLARTDLFFLLWFVLGRKFIEHPFLFARCKEVEKAPNGYLDLWARGHCKAIDINELIPTPTGFRKHGALEVGDAIYSPSGKQIKVIARTNIVTNAECFKVSFDCGYSVVVSGQHLWTIEKESRRRIEGDKREKVKIVTIDTVDLLKEVKSSKNHSNKISPRILISQPVVNQKKELSIDPYVLGLWLGNGSKRTNIITCGYQDLEQILENISLTKHKVSFKKRKTTASISIDPGIRGKNKSCEFTNNLRTLQIYKSKKIPDIYFNASIEQRWNLLQGLMDSDGTCNKKHSQASFSNINLELAQGVLNLASSLGLKTSLIEKRGKFKGKPYNSYLVQFRAHKNKDCFRLKRKQELASRSPLQQTRYYRVINVEKVNNIPVSCIQVDSEDGLYLIGSHHIATHNSTILTFGKTIQDILASHGEDPLPEWLELTKGSEPSFAIFSGTNKIATDMLKMIKNELETNIFLIDLFSDILYHKPDSDASQWNLSGITVKRKATSSISATLEAYGIDSLPTGKRFNVMIFDDCVNDTNVTTPDQIAASKWQWGQAQNLSMKGMVTLKRHIGTFYHWNDLYCELIDKKAVIPRKHPATHDGTLSGQLVYLSAAEWEENLRTLDTYNIGCQHLLNPSPTSVANFRWEWLHYTDFNHRKQANKYIIVDPASSQEKCSDYTVMMVIAVSADRNYYVIDMIRDKLSLLERTQKLFELYQRYRPIRVGYEQYGMQCDIEHIQYEQKLQNYHFTIVPLSNMKGSRSKEDRISKLLPDFENGRIFLPQVLNYRDYEGRYHNLVDIFIKEEYLQFPTSKHDDMLDALARIKDPALGIVFPELRFEREERDRFVEFTINSNSSTGY